MAALKALEKRTYRNGALVEFRDVDYNILTFKEQIMADLGAYVVAQIVSTENDHSPLPPPTPISFKMIFASVKICCHHDICCHSDIPFRYHRHGYHDRSTRSGTDAQHIHARQVRTYITSTVCHNSYRIPHTVHTHFNSDIFPKNQE